MNNDTQSIAGDSKVMAIVKRIIKDRSFGLVMACVVLLLMAWRLTPQLLTGDAINDMLKLPSKKLSFRHSRGYSIAIELHNKCQLAPRCWLYAPYRITVVRYNILPPRVENGPIGLSKSIPSEDQSANSGQGRSRLKSHLEAAGRAVIPLRTANKSRGLLVKSSNPLF